MENDELTPTNEEQSKALDAIETRMMELTNSARFEAIRDFLAQYVLLLPPRKTRPNSLLEQLMKDLIRVSDEFDGNFQKAIDATKIEEDVEARDD